MSLDAAQGRLQKLLKEWSCWAINPCHACTTTNPWVTARLNVEIHPLLKYQPLGWIRPQTNVNFGLPGKSPKKYVIGSSGNVLSFSHNSIEIPFWRCCWGFFLTKPLHFQKDVGLCSHHYPLLSAREKLYPRPGSYSYFQLLKPAQSSLLPLPSSNSPCSPDGSGEHTTSWRSLHLSKMLPATPCWSYCPSHTKSFGFVQHHLQQHPALCRYHRDLN